MALSMAMLMGMGMAANRRKAAYLPCGLVFVLALLPQAAFAAEEESEQKPLGADEVVPRIELKEIYTDNVRLEPEGSEDSDLITVISPGVNISREGSRARLELDYEANGLIFAKESELNRVNHRLLGKGNAILKPDWFYFDGLASYAQSVISSSGKASLSAATGYGGLNDVGTLRLSPYMLHDFGGQVIALARLTREQVFYSGGGISESEINSADVNLQSGRYWRTLTWSLTYRNSKENRESAADNKFESARGDASYRLTDTLRLLAQVGYENNDLNTTSKATENGTYYSAGASWRPSRYYGARALYGDKYKSASVMLNPTRRSDFEVTYYNREVGTNLGETWQASARHRGRKLSLSASYLEDTTTYQRIELERFQPVVDAGGNLVFNSEGSLLLEGPSGELIGITPEGFLTRTDELIERQRSRVAAQYKTGRSTVHVSVFREDRTLLDTAGEQTSKGGDASWQRQLSGRTTSILRGGLNKTDREVTGLEDDLWFLLWRLEYRLSPDAMTSVELRHTEQNSTNARNEYKENRAILRFRMEF